MIIARCVQRAIFCIAQSTIIHVYNYTILKFANKHKRSFLNILEVNQSIVIAHHMAGEKVCDEEETGSPGRLAVPTGFHDPHHNLGRSARSWHGVPAGHLLHHLLVVQGRVGVELFGVEHLPLEYPKTPDVRGRRDHLFGDALGCHPTNGGGSPRFGCK